MMPTFFEFFAGGGMARAGLCHAWCCAFANDFDAKKGETYRENWGAQELRTADVRKLSLTDLPAITPDLVWGSFPCQDLSLAGGGAGLRGDRSGTFWPFWALMKKLAEDGRAPRIIALENVGGTLTSHGGKDFAAIVDAYADLGYRTGAVLIDAELFVPQSRPRLFFVGIRAEEPVPMSMSASGPCDPWHTNALQRAYAGLSDKGRASWIWWNFNPPSARSRRLIDIVERHGDHLAWHSAAETQKILTMMSALHRKKVEKAAKVGTLQVGAIYRRTRRDEGGLSVQRAEVRFDEVAGCLRTPAGGSSRQVLLMVEGKSIRSRLISARETARLMGLSDKYKLPERYNEAYHLTGDGVVVDVVRYLSDSLLCRLIPNNTVRAAA